jgi:hypothetical protein
VNPRDSPFCRARNGHALENLVVPIPPCDVCGNITKLGPPPRPTVPDRRLWTVCGACLAVTILGAGGAESRVPYQPPDDRWCSVVDESVSYREIDHATLTDELTLCGADIAAAGLTGYPYSWSPERPTACPVCREKALAADALWRRGVRGRA